MTDEILRYDIWVEEALRSVIKKTLTHVFNHGLPGDHHFYISFLTQAEGVVISDHLRAQHPVDMTIVLQYQYDDLMIDEDTFSVVLSFGGKKEHLLIPYTAVISFADPSVNFALQLKMMDIEVNDTEDDNTGEGPEIKEDAHIEYFETTRAHADAHPTNAAAKQSEPDEGVDKKCGEVIALDAFRKK